jgi:AAA+ superfamily predicted ATPase
MNVVTPFPPMTEDETVPARRPSASAVAMPLTPSQTAILGRVERLMAATPIIGLMGGAGFGKSLLLRTIAERHGGIVVTARDMMEIASRAPAEEFAAVIGERLLDFIRRAPVVCIDDLAPFYSAGVGAAARPGFIQIIMLTLYRLAIETGHRLILPGQLPESWTTVADQFGNQAVAVAIPGFGPADYAAIAAFRAGPARVSGVDFQEVHRFARHLNGYQLTLALAMLDGTATIDTQALIASLEENVIISNTRAGEVEAITFDGLPGHEHIVDALETNIVIPMEHRELAHKLGLKPKRGVLLFGPPGTGKTSIGRALAHHMRGKFFLIDGSFVSEPPDMFFQKLDSVVREAKEHAPSVLFIDDADVLFGQDRISGLARYLLSLLDGIESESASRVCVIMTAMDVRLIPEALLRSGRIELWLETRTPDLDTREKILARWTADDTDLLGDLDHRALALETEGFTPADLRRLVSDGKALMARDIVHKRPLRPTTLYFTDAIQALLASRGRMNEALGETGMIVGSARGYEPSSRGA